MTDSPLNDQDYSTQLAGVLRSRDPEALRGFLIESARRFGDPTQITELQEQTPDQLLILMHRMTTARPDLAAFHAESEAWLQSHGQSPPKPSGGSPRSSGRGQSRPGKRR
jgi:hypothetical protein